jgi:hypothetical protein
MKILNFIPLLVWSLGFLFLIILEEHWLGKSESDAGAKMYYVGFLVWLLIGIICLL